MNKRGYLTNFIFGFIGLFVLILVITALLSVKKGGMEKDRIIGTFDNTNQKTIASFNISKDNSPITNVIYSFVGFVIYSSFEIAKLAITYGVDNPDVINPITLFWLVILSLILPIMFVLIKVVIIVWILVKDYIQSRKEKDWLKRKEGR